MDFMCTIQRWVNAYASDTECIIWKFPGVNHVLVEANYSMDLVDRDEPNYEHRLRGHMSIDTTCLIP